MLRAVIVFFAICFFMGSAWADISKVKPAAEKAGWKAKDYNKARSMGLKKSERMPRVPADRIAPRRAMPESLDYRTMGYVTPIKDQGNCGSCWAFSAVGVLESAYIFSGKSPTLDLSEQIVVSCDSSNWGCNGGYMDNVSDFLKTTGTGVESCYPYLGSNGKCSSACANWKNFAYKSLSWGYAATVQPDLANIKTALINYGPLITTFAVYTDFMYYESGVYKYSYGSLEGYHAVIIVGYNDNGSYLIVKNSWGPDWGESGYFRIAYSELKSKVLFGEETIYFVVGDLPPDPDPEPEPEPTPGCNAKAGKPGENTIKWFQRLFE